MTEKLWLLICTAFVFFAGAVSLSFAKQSKFSTAGFFSSVLADQIVRKNMELF